MPIRGKLFWPAVFTAVYILQAAIQIHSPRDGAPLALDQAEVHNIAWNLAHGRGYSFDWDDKAWRQTYIAHSRPSEQLSMILCRSGSHPTMSRPPLMPLLVAVAIKLYPAHAFLLWRLFDAALFSLAATLLTAALCATTGTPAAVIVLALTLLDPLRSAYVPGWWTEGMAFDAMAAIVWLLAVGRAQLGRWTIPTSGILLGLLCLDRSFFVLVLPLLAILLGYTAQTLPFRRLLAAAAIFAIAILLQLPWWFRNIELAHQMLPLGTQGGFNFPDEYSDHAIALRGGWDGDAIGWVWSTRPGAPPSEAAGDFPPDVASMRPAHPRAGDALYATMCRPLDSEIAVCNLGMKSGIAWIKSHPTELPRLFIMKMTTELGYDRWWMIVLFIATAAGLLLAPRNELSTLLLALIVVYLLGIGVTHAMPGRFLIPLLPPLYALAASGLVITGRRAGF